jgi:hypothetical protein
LVFKITFGSGIFCGLVDFSLKILRGLKLSGDFANLWIMFTFVKNIRNMTATIELPNNKNEIVFILEVLKRLNVKVIKEDNLSSLTDEVMEEHAAILRQRRLAMNAADAQFFTWEEAQNILKNRKKS